MQVQLITAPGDGVAPAVLLSLPSGGGSNGALAPAAQYLFNVPEGFSRLVLEHKLRPGGPSCLCSHPAACHTT
jgi:ribonuclease Z